MDIEIVGALDGSTYYDVSHILSLLQQQHTDLVYGESFVGRPGTQLYVGKNDIVKLRTELNINEKQARRFIEHILGQEKQLSIHHPHKTWFLFQEDDNLFKVGNICPRLIPLHKLIEHQPGVSDQQKLVYLKEIYRHYLQIAASYSLRLDEGLSNFGIDEQGKLYYLDDDVYAWDDFHTFSHLVGVLVRNPHWLNEDSATDLGIYLNELISQYFKEIYKTTMVANKLKDIFIPDAGRARVLNIIIEKLRQQHHPVNKKLLVKSDYLAILADIHANLPALDAVLDYLQAENIQQGIVLGDIVGYGPHPGSCVERLRQTDFTIIKGNHDHAAVTGDTQRGMSSLAKSCIEWTIAQLTAAQKKWLDDLPLELSSSDEFPGLWMAVHGSPIDPNFFYAYVYEMTYTKNLDNLAKRQIRHCFHGHTHVQGIYARKIAGLDDFYKPEDRGLDKFSHTLICPGSIGQPRDGRGGAQFAIYNQKTDAIKFVVLPYAVEKTIADLKKNGFAQELGDRLRTGN